MRGAARVTGMPRTYTDAWHCRARPLVPVGVLDSPAYLPRIFAPLLPGARARMALACDGHGATPLRADRRPSAACNAAGGRSLKAATLPRIAPCSLRGLSLCNGGSHSNHPLPADNKGPRAKGG